MLLDGLRILEIGKGTAVAFCGKQLADLGAEVVKVEKPDTGDELRHCGPFAGGGYDPEKSIPFLYSNTNKYGITLDLEKPGSAQIILQLCKHFDLIITDYPDNYLHNLGLAYSDLKRQFPSIIMTSIEPYRVMPEYRDCKAYNINISALSGVSMVLGEKGREPIEFPYCSQVAAASAAAAALVAVLDRERTNQGRHVEVSEIEVMADLIYDISIGTGWGLGKPFNRIGPRGSQYIYPWTMLPVRDGYITITFLGPKGKEWWNTFLKLIGDPEWAQDPKYQDFEAMSAYAEEVDGLLEPLLQKFTKEELFTLCRQKGLPVVPVRNPQEALEDPHFKEHRNFIKVVSRPDFGDMVFPGLPFLTDAGQEVMNPPPRLGEHNEQVYKKYLNLTSDRLQELREEGII